MPKNWKIRFFGNFLFYGPAQIVWPHLEKSTSVWLIDTRLRCFAYFFLLLKESFKRWMAMGVLMVWYMR